MKFQENKYYSHRNFIDCYFKVLTIFPDDRMLVSWYNKKMNQGKFWIDNEMLTIKSTENWSEYAVK